MAAINTLDNFHSCAQLGAAPPKDDGPGGEDRLALDNRSLWPNGSELIVNMWGYVPPSSTSCLQLTNIPAKATSSAAK